LELGTILSQFYKSIEKLGFNTGAEFKIAVEESKKMGIKVLLGDRDVDITLQRLSKAISSYPSET
jgi:pheromone shutdown protein TraB